MSHFGEFLLKARQRAGLTQKELGKRVGVDDSYISRLERGVYSPPTRDVVLGLAAALDIIEKTREWVEFLLEAGVATKEDLEGFTLVNVGAGQATAQGQQAISPPLPSIAHAQQPPAAVAVEGALLLQILGQLQALTAVVSQLQTELIELKHRTAIPPHWALLNRGMDYRSLRDMVWGTNAPAVAADALAEQSSRDDLGVKEIVGAVAAGRRQEPTKSEIIEFKGIGGMLYRVFEELNALPELDRPHSGRIILTYLVEEDAFRHAQELEERWFPVLKSAIARGWNVLHFIWLNEDVKRTNHLVRNTLSLLGGRGNYQVYFTKTSPLRASYDFLAVDAPVDHLKRAFEFHALEANLTPGPRSIDSGRLYLPPDYEQINKILKLLKGWEEGKAGFQQLLRVEQNLRENFDAARQWDMLVTETEEHEGDLFLVMKGFTGNTVPNEQYLDQLKPILGRRNEEADLIRYALDLRKRRVAAFKKQVRQHKFRQIIPMVAMDWYKETGFHSPDAWAYLFNGKPAKAEQQAEHLLAILDLLETYPDSYQLGLLTGDAGEYHKVFWEVKATHTVLLENFDSGQELDVSITESTVAEAFREEFKRLWESDRVITDQEYVKKWLRDHAEERAAAIS